MQGTEFEDDKNFSGLSSRASQFSTEKPSFMFTILQKMGIADKATANFVLLAVAMFFLCVTIFLYSGILGENVPSEQSVQQITEQIRAMREMQGIQ